VGVVSIDSSQPRILWPAPGLPALLSPSEQNLEVLVAAEALRADPLASWADGLGLRAVDGSPSFRLPVRDLVAGIPACEEPRVAAAAAALGVRHVVRFALDASAARAPDSPRRSRVFDLERAGACVRSRAVVRHAPGARIRIGFASDLHHAELWNAVHEALRRFAPDLAARALDPNAQVRRLVDDANRRAARGELDAIVLGGDLVDHVYRVARGACDGSADHSNWPELLEALAPLDVPSFAIPGNHDHRLYPWRPRVYGLEAIGVPPARLRGALRAGGLWDAWPLRPRDVDALRTREPDGRDGLSQYLVQMAPSPAFARDIGDLRLVFLSTGRDVLCRWSGVEPGRGRLLARSLRTSWEHPDSEGLDDAQIALLTEALRTAKRGAAIFLHAPLVHPVPDEAIEARLPNLAPGADDGQPARIRFEQRLYPTGLRQGVFFRNPAPFLRALQAADAPLTVVSGHIHRCHAWRWDSVRGDTRSCRLPLTGRGDGVLFAHAPAVAHAPPRETDQVPGYLVASFESGALCGLERVPLPPSGG
jgi:hypothetical protein